MPLNAINHPLIAHKIALLRQQGISTKQFRELANEVASLLTYEATRDLPLENREVNGWQGEPINTQMLSGKKLSVVPILRAGLGMLDGVLTLVPNAKVSVVGLYRDEETLDPVAYFDKVITDIDQRTALIIDPMLATGGTLLATIDLLKQKGCKKIIGLFLVASPEGLERVTKLHPDVDLFIAAIDDSLKSDHGEGSLVNKYEFNGVSLLKINKEHTLDNRDKTFNSYLVKINNESKAFNTTIQGGGAQVNASQNIPFEYVRPDLNAITPSGTSINARVKTTSGTSISGSEISFQDKGYENIAINKLKIAISEKI